MAVIEEFKGYFREVGGFPDAVDADEGNCVGSFFVFVDV